MILEAAPVQREGEEEAEAAIVVKRSWEEAQKLDAAWKSEKKDYPQREMTELLLREKYPELKAQSIGERLRDEPEMFVATIDGKEREVVVVSHMLLGMPGFENFEGIATSTLDDRIVIAKGFGPCPFLAGFREGKGFIAHILPQNANRYTIERLLNHLGIGKGDEKTSLFVGGGQTGKPMFGTGQSSSIRRTALAGAELHGIPATDINARRDLETAHETTAVGLDPVKRLIVVLVDSEDKEGK